MICHLSYLALGGKRREELQGYDPDFPHLAIDSDLDRYAEHCVAWHWHEPFEFNRIVCGEVEIAVPGKTYRLRPGDGLFVNANVLHTAHSVGNQPGARLHAQIFDSSLIASEGRLLRRYVGPVAACAQIRALPFFRGEARDAAALNTIDRAFSSAEAETPGYEMEIRSLLLDFFREVYLRAQGSLEATAAPGSQDERLKQMLAFIQTHYEQEISPRDIAKSASICERECFRAFKRTLGVTPLGCLTAQRVSRAAQLLAETDLPVTEIALSCGFSSPGYFGKVFKNRMGLSPGGYRGRAKNP